MQFQHQCPPALPGQRCRQHRGDVEMEFLIRFQLGARKKRLEEHFLLRFRQSWQSQADQERPPDLSALRA